MNGEIEIHTLTDGGQAAGEVARLVAGFVGGARESLELAQYDFNLGPETAELVGGALRDAAARGVHVRFVYNVDHENPIPVPPPPEPDTRLIASLGVPARAIAGIPDLMHHKYVVRDGETVWTGSANWTDESWSRQENVVVVIRSRELAVRFVENFDGLWEHGEVARSGFESTEPLDVGGTLVRPWFTPGRGEDLAHRIAEHIGRARKVRICSPVLTSGPILGTVAERVAEGADVAGCVDLTQVQDVVRQWRANGNVAWKLPLLAQALSGRFSGKGSTPWRAGGSVHDFMHAKICACDGVVFVGSFNLSRSGERNAENVVEIHDAAVAGELATFVDQVRALYPPVQLDGSGRL